MTMDSRIKDISAASADPERVLKNLTRLLRKAPDLVEDHEQQLDDIAKLFCYSQFLADYGIENPADLSRALRRLDLPVKGEAIISEFRDLFKLHIGEPISSLKKNAMAFLRKAKKNYLLRITLRDLSGVTGLMECMAELSALADALTQAALDIAEFILRERFGFMRDDAFTVMGLGKLGAGELNYSSDIDILTVYRFENRSSTGILTPYGIRTNKIDSQEYFCRLTEILTGLLHSPTEDGTVYRVDLRLRPNGQKGPVSLSLDSYRSYYESWGKTWERLALIRSRPAAGDSALGEDYIRTIEPFVWKRSTDYHDIEEIRDLKKKIDAIFDINDIKRGYGGIREIEFFVQTFQLLYGGEGKILRGRTIVEVLDELLRQGFLQSEDVKTLSENYLFLRRLEHVLQMRDDVRTHSLPSNPAELDVLSKKMGFRHASEFLSDLKLRRLKVRHMYNSLLGGPGETQEAVLSLQDELPEDAIRDYLSFKGFRDAEAASGHMRVLRDQISTGKTIRERTLLRKLIPAFLEQIMKSPNKDRTLSMLVSFVQKIGNHESYTDLLLQRRDTREIIISAFSRSSYLTRSLLSIENFEGIFEYPDIRIDYRSLQERLINMLYGSADPLDALREVRITEELKAGLLFLNGSFDVFAFSKALSSLADTIIRALVRYLSAEREFAVIGLGGFGARDLNIGSDLDLLFIGSRATPAPSGGKTPAEEMIRLLSEYTSKGFVYKVDMRLRPDGEKGVLINDIEGYENYYLKSAKPWEIQSLIRARPVAGDMRLLKSFQRLRRRLIIKRGTEINALAIKAMRKRIIREVSKEAEGYDLKNGPGGIKEIEFLAQYLQLKHSRKFPDLIIFSTVPAIKRLAKYGILDRISEERLLASHTFLRSVDTLLRFDGEEVVKADHPLLDAIMLSLNLGSRSEVINGIEQSRSKVAEIAEKYY